MRTITNVPTGHTYSTKYWAAILEAAALRPHLRRLVANYERTEHPACLSAIMNNADANLWITYYTGRITDPS
jgi:hypothetical protein